MANAYSIVEYYGYESLRQCGYCNKSDTNCNHGMWAHCLTVQDYQDLIDRGWRRSGCYCYKPTLDKTCCPMYTIRCEALDFKLTKSQKKILRRMAKYLRNETNEDTEGVSKPGTPDDDAVADTSNLHVTNYEERRARAEENAAEMRVASIQNEKDEARPAVASPVGGDDNDEDVKPEGPSSCTSTENRSQERSSTTRKTTRETSRPPPKKAKLIRVERKKKKLLAQGKTAEEIDTLFRSDQRGNVARSVEDFFREIHNGVKKLETKLVRVMSDEFLSSLDVSANLYKKYQMAIHDSEPEQCDKKSFVNFLVKSPLKPYSPRDGPPQGYGSFHEQYWLDGRLIAVAVIDILPLSVSSVYFFYDPEFAFLSLGTFSSLREVCLTRQLNALAPSIKYYYMGYYIHSNVKMRYKARVKPSKLLCPETYQWCDLETAIAKIAKEKYSRLNEGVDEIDEDGQVDIEKVKILNRHRVMTYGSYGNRSDEEDASVRGYARLVGRKCAQRMLLYRH